MCEWCAAVQKLLSCTGAHVFPIQPSMSERYQAAVLTDAFHLSFHLITPILLRHPDLSVTSAKLTPDADHTLLHNNQPHLLVVLES